MNRVILAVLRRVNFAMKTITKVCKHCGVEFTKRDNGNPHTFCSRECGGKWHMQNRVMRGPSLVGNTFRKGIRPTNAFTSSEVRGENNPNWKKGGEFKCECCSKLFFVKPWLVTQNGKPRFCSRECFIKSGVFVGDKSVSWVGGPTTYRGRGWLAARKLAVTRDNGCCVVCSKQVGSSIHVHHIVPFRNFESIADANAITNLVCLCGSCHPKHEHTSPEKFLSILLLSQSQCS